MPAHRDTVQLIAINPDALAEVLAKLDAVERRLDALTRPPERMSLPAAATYCGVKVATVRGWIAAGKLEARGSERQRTVARDDLDKWRK